MGSIYKRTWKDKKTGKTIKGDIYWIAYYRDGKQYHESTGETAFDKAKDQLKTKEGDIARGLPVTPNFSRIKFSELTEDVTTDYRNNGRKTLRDLTARLKHHITPVFGETRASAITTVEIRKFVDKRKGEGATNAEINRELAVIKRAFSLAVQAGRIIQKPYIPMLKENNVRQGFFEPEQFRAVCSKLPADLQPMVTFAFIAGWRIRSEVWTLKWTQVDFNAGRVRLEPGTTKNDEARDFPMTQQMRAVLELQKAKVDQLKKRGKIVPWVFFRKDGRPIREFRRSWRTACTKAGVPGKIPHDFRRTAVRTMVRAGIPERVAMKLTGHKTRSVFERYNIVSENDLDNAARKLDAIAITVCDTSQQNKAVGENPQSDK
jgi:integrase